MYPIVVFCDGLTSPKIIRLRTNRKVILFRLLDLVDSFFPQIVGCHHRRHTLIAFTFPDCSRLSFSIVIMLAIKTPIPTATIRSTNTVSAITPYMIMVGERATLCARFKKLQSRILIPTYKAMPASTAIGIGLISSDAPSTTSKRIKALVMPASGDLPPDCMLFTTGSHSGTSAEEGRQAGPRRNWLCLDR